ncbi:TPA: hypothetical protein MO340_004195 [Salmonella enterica subsp. salamae serovar 35:g,m,s,t:-]|nr:hypothetical protein [Salmonella enterica subsp. salamae serovar 35:g,m,s,t:-]HCA3549667.1 hypothetical protein [Salmonella enterica subsp. salamae serovar 35:g,m,s,t:-]
MNIQKVKNVYDFMQYCRMPLWYQRTVRDMKVGDIFFLGQYKEETTEGSDEYFIAEAWIERTRGAWHFHGTWTHPTKASRPLIMTDGEFRVLKGGTIVFSKEGAGVREFALVSRYLDYLVRKMTKEQKLLFISKGSKPLYRGVWVDKNFIDRQEHVRYGEKGKLEHYRLDYRGHAPTHQLHAIISAGLALGQIE